MGTVTESFSPATTLSGALSASRVAVDPTANGALSFNAADPDRVSISGPADPGTGDFTIRALIASYSTSGSPDYRFLITKGAGGGLNGFRWGLSGVTPYLLVGGTAHYIEQQLSSTTFPNDGNWHSLTITVSRSTNIATAYIDGVSVGSASIATIGTESISSASALVFGSGGSSAIAYTGKLDEVAYWNACLSASEVLALEGYEINASDARLNGLWRFDEGSGSTIVDSSAAGHNGVLVTATRIAGATLLAPSAIGGGITPPARPSAALSSIALISGALTQPSRPSGVLTQP